MNVCSNCGKEISEDAAHCGHCGEAVEVEQKKTMIGVGAVDADDWGGNAESDTDGPAESPTDASDLDDQIDGEADPSMAETELMEAVDLPEPHDDELGDDEPHDDELGDDEPHDDEPGDDEPGDDEPGDDEPGDDEPGDVEADAPAGDSGEPGDQFAVESLGETGDEHRDDGDDWELGETEDTGPEPQVEPTTDDREAPQASEDARPEPRVEASVGDVGPQTEDQTTAGPDQSRQSDSQTDMTGGLQEDLQADGLGEQAGPSGQFQADSPGGGSSTGGASSTGNNKRRRRLLMFVGVMFLAIVGCCAATGITYLVVGGPAAGEEDFDEAIQELEDQADEFEDEAGELDD